MDNGHLRILAVNAHPHDFTHYAGTLGMHASRGDEVTIVSITSGANTHNEALRDELLKPPEERDPKIMNQTLEEYSEIKAVEMRKACGLFGISDVRILDFPQPFVMQSNPESIDALRDIIHEVRPDVMITQSPYLDGPNGRVSGEHDDHLETAYVSLEARAAAIRVTFGSTEPPHKIAATYFPGVYFGPEQFSFLVDVGEWFEKRVEAEATFKSQGHTPEGSRHRVSLTLGRTGFQFGLQYAEAFVREKPEILPGFVLPEAALAMAQETSAARSQRRLGQRSSN